MDNNSENCMEKFNCSNNAIINKIIRKDKFWSNYLNSMQLSSTNMERRKLRYEEVKKVSEMPDFNDIKVLCKNEKILEGNKTYLCNSPVIREKFKMDYKMKKSEDNIFISNPNTFDMTDLEYSVAQQLINCLHFGSDSIDFENFDMALEIYKASKTYMVKELEKICLAYFEFSINEIKELKDLINVDEFFQANFNLISAFDKLQLDDLSDKSMI